MPEQVEQSPQTPQTPPVQPGGLSENAACALAYITFIPAIIFLVIAPYNQNPKVRFHCWQSISLAVVAVIVEVGLTVLSVIPGLVLLTGPLALIIWLAFFVLWLIVVMNALNGKMLKIPVIADFAAKQAGL